MKLADLCSKCKKKKWNCGVESGKKKKTIVYMCDDCTFGPFKRKKKK